MVQARTALVNCPASRACGPALREPVHRYSDAPHQTTGKPTRDGQLGLGIEVPEHRGTANRGPWIQPIEVRMNLTLDVMGRFHGRP